MPASCSTITVPVRLSVAPDAAPNVAKVTDSPPIQKSAPVRLPPYVKFYGVWPVNKRGKTALMRHNRDLGTIAIDNTW
jgi:hypothetical protein